MFRVTKHFEFDAAHRLLGHPGKCKHLHGHTYKAEITVECVELDDQGRVVDFGVIKDEVGGWIDKYWDHAVILNKEDSLCDRPIGKAPFTLSGNPTAENMAAFLFVIAVKNLEPSESSRIRVSKVRVYETTDSWADYQRE